MQRFSEGDRVRVDIPDETDPNHERYHGVRRPVVAVLEAGDVEVFHWRSDCRDLLVGGGE